MLEDAEKKGLITPGKVSSHCSTTHYRTVLVKIICSVLKATKRPKASWVRLDAKVAPRRQGVAVAQRRAGSAWMPRRRL